MRILIPVLFLLVMIGCKTQEKVVIVVDDANIVEKPLDVVGIQDCIDKSKINRKAPCTKEYKPVCGCDDKTYSNVCEAKSNGVTSWRKGKCPSPM